MLITFVVLCYNQEKLIEKALNSIIAANIPKKDYKIIVIDDGSIDNSIEAIKKFDVKLFHSDPELKNTKNQSLCRNIGIKNASGKYIRFLDGDDYFNSKALLKEYYEIQNLEKDLIFTKFVAYRHSKKILRIEISNESNFEGIANYYVKNDFLKKNNIYFDEITHTFHAEDLLFYFRMLEYLKPEDIHKTSNRSYVMIKHEGSTGKICSFELNKFIEFVEYIDLMLLEIKEMVIKNKNNKFMNSEYIILNKVFSKRITENYKNIFNQK